MNDSTPLDFSVHYYKDTVDRVDPMTGTWLKDRPGPWCETKEPGIITKNQSRVDCSKCIRWAGIKGKQP